MREGGAEAVAADYRPRRLPRSLLPEAVMALRPSEEECRLLVHRGITAFGVSVIGPGHRMSGTVRQDAFDLRPAGDFVVAIAADGLGSAEFSHAASAFATRRAGQRIARAVASLARPATADQVEGIIRAEILSIAQVLQDAETRGAPGPLYTTILGAVCGPDFSTIFNFGDGAVACFDCGKQGFAQRRFLGPEHGDYVGQVHPLLLEGFGEHFRAATCGKTERVLVATDGAADFIATDDETAIKVEFAEAFEAALREIAPADAPREMAAYLAGDRASAVNADDKTLLWLEL